MNHPSTQLAQAQGTFEKRRCYHHRHCYYPISIYVGACRDHCYLYLAAYVKIKHILAIYVQCYMCIYLCWIIEACFLLKRAFIDTHWLQAFLCLPTQSSCLSTAVVYSVTRVCRPAYQVKQYCVCTST